jgi:pantetheine-phosphate adenylyltransferase
VGVKAVMPGSFDPITVGHLDILTRATRLFDHVIIAVGVNIGKQSLFSVDRRVEMARQAVRGLGNVSVAKMDGLLADFCRHHQVSTVVRGARSGADFEAEWAMAAMNASLGAVETVVLPASPQVAYISSTLVRSVARAGGDVSGYVPTGVSLSIPKEY